MLWFGRMLTVTGKRLERDHVFVRVWSWVEVTTTSIGTTVSILH